MIRPGIEPVVEELLAVLDDEMDLLDLKRSQLAQLSQLEQLEGLGSTFEKVLLSTQLSEATAMIDKQVTFFPTGLDSAVSAPVTSVDIVDGEIWLNAGEYRVPLDGVLSIRNVTEMS